MKVTLLCVGKTDEGYLREGIEKYQKRLVHYTRFSEVILPDIKNRKTLTEEQQRDREGELLLKQIDPTDTVVLLDERGQSFSSPEFAAYLEQCSLRNFQHLVFVVGGPYGFCKAVYQRANAKIALSKMTFSHQMVRLFFMEQLYRAHTIMRGEPYHHM